MLGFLTTEVLMWMAGGFILKEQLDASKKNAQQAAPQQQAAPPVQQFQQAPPEQLGAYAPGMPVQVEGRKPTGPVALDAHIEPQTEAGVWRCLQDADVERARDFAIKLAQGGLPVAAAVVSYHVHILQQVRDAQAAQAAEVARRATPPVQGKGPTYGAPEPAPPQGAPREGSSANGRSAVVQEPARAPHEVVAEVE
jgi:hypothetical protein